MPNIASMIDHTLLKADATEKEIVALCEEAKAFQFCSVCVNPIWVQKAKQMLKDSSVKVCTVIGFPLGATTSGIKAKEAEEAIENGADEVDMVINIGAMKAGNLDQVEQDISAVVNASDGRALVKAIIETSLLTDEEKTAACEAAVRAGVDYVKTSTGFSTGGATLHDIALMRKAVGPDIGVKASGGIRNREAVESLVKAGATRIGASASVTIVTSGMAAKKANDY